MKGLIACRAITKVLIILLPHFIILFTTCFMEHMTAETPNDFQ